MNRFQKMVCIAAAIAGAAGCAASEYTVSEAQADLVKSGLTAPQAQCVLDGLTKRFSDRYIKLNNEEQVDRVNPDAVALYVRNVFASQDTASNDDQQFARQLVVRCRS